MLWLTRVWCFSGLMLAVLALPVRAAELSGSWAAVSMPGAQQLDVRAKQSGHRYRIFVSVPSGPAPAAGYPVLYVLDGNAMFPTAAFVARRMAGRSEVTGYVAPVVVGIGYSTDDDFDVPARSRDYTVALNKPEVTATEGGAELFLDLIENEIKPLIAQKVAVDLKRQALFGHSYGGLLVLHTLLTRPESFSTYLVSSPSIWWRDKLILTELKHFMTANSALQPRVQISVGALEDQPPKGNLSPERLALLAKRPMVSEAREIAASLRKMPHQEGQVVYHELAGEDHGLVWMPAMTRGMIFFMEQP